MEKTIEDVKPKTDKEWTPVHDLRLSIYVTTLYKISSYLPSYFKD